MRRAYLAGLTSILACGGSSERSGDRAAAAPAAATVVRIVGKDFAFEAPDTVAAGLVTLNLTSQGEPHHAQLVRLLDGKTFADFGEAMKTLKPTDPPPPWVRLLPSPQVPAPGTESKVTVSLEPGNYALICFVESADRVPHVAKGMAKSLTVIPSASAAASPPVADLTATLSDYTWSLSAPLTPGTHTVKYENTAQQPHEMVFLRLEPGKTAEDAMKWAESFQGPPPFQFAGGVTNFSPGEVGYGTLDVTPGNYLLICFYPDVKDGKPHFMHGMVKPLTVS
jgi:hypothetical protein